MKTVAYFIILSIKTHTTDGSLDKIMWIYKTQKNKIKTNKKKKHENLTKHFWCKKKTVIHNEVYFTMILFNLKSKPF